MTTLSTVDREDQTLTIKDICESILHKELTIARKKSRLPLSFISNTVFQTTPTTSTVTNSAIASSSAPTQSPVVYVMTRPLCISCGFRNHTADNCWHALEKASWQKDNPRNSPQPSASNQDPSRPLSPVQPGYDGRGPRDPRYDNCDPRYDTRDPRYDSYDPGYDLRDNKELYPDYRYHYNNRLWGEYRSQEPDPLSGRAHAMILIPCRPLDTPYTDHACTMCFPSNNNYSKVWMLDSGAPNHYTSHRHDSTSFRDTNPVPIEEARRLEQRQEQGNRRSNSKRRWRRLRELLKKHLSTLKDNTLLPMRDSRISSNSTCILVPKPADVAIINVETMHLPPTRDLPK